MISASFSAPSLPLAMGIVGEFIEWGIIAVVFLFLVNWISKAVPNKRDREWLPGLVMWGFGAKLMGTLFRYYMVADLYGSSDSFQYHGRGSIFARIWRSGAVPQSTAGGEGTAFTEVVTGLVYSIHTPAMRGGFLMFAFIAFIGQLLFYMAFRPWLKDKALKRYALVVLFFPSIIFWPASVGKDSLMILFIGLATLGISRLLRRVELIGLLLAGLGLYLTAEIRPHIAMMLALAAVLAFVFMKREGGSRGAKRLIPLTVAVVGVVFTWSTFAADFEVSLQGEGETQDPAAFLDRVANQTGQGGSQVDGGVVEGIQDIPAATIKVLFRPLIHEGTSAAILLSALEGTAVLILVIWRLPTIWRNRAMLRPNPLLLLSFFYTGGFIVAFSSVLNLGIMARQRVQLLPFFLALVVAMGWPQDDEGDGEQENETSTPALTPAGHSSRETAFNRNVASRTRLSQAQPESQQTGRTSSPSRFRQGPVSPHPQPPARAHPGRTRTSRPTEEQTDRGP